MPKLNVGDKVKIVNVENCEFGCNPLMIKLTGKTTVIDDIYQGFNKNNKLTVRYRIQIDNGVYWWSANCLKPVDCKCKFIIKNE